MECKSKQSASHKTDEIYNLTANLNGSLVRLSVLHA